MATATPFQVGLPSRAARRFAGVVLLGALIMPPGGIGFDLCWFHAHTGLPCPGCGITRSLASLAHLDVARAFSLHPFGPPLFGLLVLAVLSGLLGEPGRARVEGWLDQHQRALRGAGGLFVASFVLFGLVRLGVAILHPEALNTGLLVSRSTLP